MKKGSWIVGLLLIAFALQVCRADTLQQVIIVTRHGVRSPTWTSDRLNQYSVAPWPDFGVPPGHLTPHGRVLMKIMGDFYRDLYVSLGLVGKPGCGDANRTYFWADTDQRTIESARALAEGLMPGCKIDVHSMAAGKVDPLFHPTETGVLKPDANLSMAALQGRIGPKIDSVLEPYGPELELLQRVLNGSGKASKTIFDEPVGLRADQANISMTGPLPLASTFTENLLLEYSNGMSGEEFGWGRLTVKELQQILVLHTSYAELMRRTRYLAEVRGSNLLSHILRTIQQKASGKNRKGAFGPTSTSLVVISGHDTNVSNLSGLLGLSWIMTSHQPDDVPPGGALVFSLWKSSDGRYKVRLQFVTQTLEQMHNAVPLTIKNPPMIANLFVSGCSIASEGFPCDLSRFESVVKSAVNREFVQP